MGKKLIIMVGLPRSGKTTLALELGHPIVCRDAIRKSVGGTIRYFKEEERVNEIEEMLIKCLFNAGHDHVILDATHLKRKYRQRWMFFSFDNDCWVQYRFVLTPAIECMRRAMETHPDDPNFPKIIENMWLTSDMKDVIPYGS